MKRVPAEWEPQRAVWIAWPHNHDTWPGRFETIPDRFRRFVELIAAVVPVHVIGSSSLRPAAKLDGIENALWFDIETNDCWMRDYGPTFVHDDAGQPAAIDWRYNAWGGKYPPWDADNAATAEIIRHSGRQRIASDLCVEGGALEWDGQGRLLTTSNCLVTDTRNPGWSRQQISQTLESLTGTTEIIWVDGGGLAGDDTDGHIDQLARFIDAKTIVVAVCDDPQDPNHAGLEANFQLLSDWAKTTDPKVSIHRLPIPPARFIDGQRVPESYCNFLRLGPDRLLVPTFRNDASDQHAIGLLGQLAQNQSPAIETIGVDCHDLVWGLGALHCASCNEPLVTNRKTS
ncbi:agmatine deiminase family protein [Stieleria sp. TO1_6]|uniref:agmatine deiminase family protein n=1 Tax=Stieleria tagensis TaxID=2956795 RepID=UPI00209B2386|nr:agmatine deiminase family protein [Stieleria tagensis]MCO8123607.1 agmatine deiminase family protein [Stieleria tagensis]